MNTKCIVRPIFKIIAFDRWPLKACIEIFVIQFENKVFKISANKNRIFQRKALSLAIGEERDFSRVEIFVSRMFFRINQFQFEDSYPWKVKMVCRTGR